ncbi:KRI1-like family C-terminal-domain-containing protein [Thelonectria olida]|uniref:KRI1-like family C-terminal-domain-containing protein n=1 Tax=Thelonectria olida TaxID=1576542 RepID=A0A9P9APZ0_9HYPO|nr:KRI1-like family C-terminal-domain-containing protein [Thelonectria olida]
MGKATMDPERAKRNLLDDSDSEPEGGASISAGFQVNQEYARRFEHNKKREEKHRLEEKFKKTGKAPAAEEDDDESSSDESEDEDGFLATEDLDAQISATLQAIRNKDPKVYDKDVTFYRESDDTTAADKEKKEKPVYLKDYHREKLLAGDVGASDDEDEDTPMNYHQEQDHLKKSILTEINAATAGDGSEDDDDGFLKKKPSAKVDSNGVHPSRKAALTITELDVATAEKNPENFLSNFMSARGWVPPDGSNWKAFESDDEDDNGQADEFEQAYNLRFEDPEKSNEFLRSYARDIAAKKSVRREEKSGRKRQRELEREQKEAEKQERRDEKARLRKLKLEEAEAKLRKIKQAAGSVGKELTDEDWMKFLDTAWEDDNWEAEMTRRFGDDYYAQEDQPPVSDEEEEEEEGDGEKKKKKHPKKPTWDDDIDIKDIIPDFEDEDEQPKISLSDAEGDHAEAGQGEDDAEEDSRPSKKRKTADIKRQKQESQKKARQERSKLEALVDSKLELSNHDLLSKPSHAPFRYRETSPQAFGMTARDILLAPSDQQLNEFAGLKKLATYRDEEKKRRDKKKLGKKARLRQWRRDVFGSEFERTGPTYGFERLITDEDAAMGGVIETTEKKAEQSNVVGEVGDSKKKKRKRSKGKKNVATAVEAEE